MEQTKESIKNLIKHANDHGHAEYDHSVKIIEELSDGFKVCLCDDDEYNDDDFGTFTIRPSNQYTGLVMIEVDNMMLGDENHLVEHVSPIPRTVFAVMYA